MLTDADLCAKPWIIPELDVAHPLRLQVELELVEARKRAYEFLGISVALPSSGKRNCKRCGVSLDLRNPHCSGCKSRHSMRRLMKDRRANSD